MQRDANGTVKLPAVLDQGTAGELLALLRQALREDQAVRLDASGVETLTLSCLQIILSAQATSDKIAIVSPSDAFAGAFEDAGLQFRQEQGGGPDRVQDKQDVAPQVEADVAPQIEAEQEQKLPPTSANGHDMSKRILTIDDSKTMRDMLMLTLTDAGFEVLQAVDGQDGLNVLKRERVDVIITDINMPVMNGYEVIQHLRANPEHKNTPILVLTTESDQENKIRARDAGATGWIVKPFDPEKLADVIYQVSP
jgi:two-component system chemotaxis response regulator CheY